MPIRLTQVTTTCSGTALSPSVPTFGSVFAARGRDVVRDFAVSHDHLRNRGEYRAPLHTIYGIFLSQPDRHVG